MEMVVVGIVVVVVVVMVVVLVLGRPLSPARLIGCWSNPLGFLRPPETINLQARWTRHPVWWCRYFHSIGIDSSLVPVVLPNLAREGKRETITRSAAPPALLTRSLSQTLAVTRRLPSFFITQHISLYWTHLACNLRTTLLCS